MEVDGEHLQSFEKPLQMKPSLIKYWICLKISLLGKFMAN